MEQPTNPISGSMMPYALSYKEIRVGDLPQDRGSNPRNATGNRIDWTPYPVLPMVCVHIDHNLKLDHTAIFPNYLVLIFFISSD